MRAATRDRVAVTSVPDEGPAPDHVVTRSHLLPEEAAAGSADPEAQAEAILTESLERTYAPHDPPDGDDDPGRLDSAEDHEHRRSEDTV